MNLKKVILIIIGFFVSAFSKESFHDFLSDNRGGLVLSFGDTDYKDPDWIEYKLLRKDMSVKSVNPNDLPDDFCDEASRLVDEFHRKTVNQEVEWMLYFDYTTGEVIYCWKGEYGSLKGNFDIIQVHGRNITSIHNHQKYYYSVPSPANFDILGNDFEDYEIITSKNAFWTVEFKGNVEECVRKDFQTKLVADFQEIENELRVRYADKIKVRIMSEKLFSDYLLTHINKSLNSIPLILTKLEYD